MKGWYFLILISIIACDNHTDYFETLDQAPVIELMGSKVQHESYVRDSVKTNHVFEVMFKTVSSSTLTFSCTKSENYTVIVDNQAIQITGSKISDNLIIFSASDAYLKHCQDTIHLTIFDNLFPIAVLNYDVTEFDGTYTLNLDGSSSYDRDAPYGGAISSYDFTVNGQHYTMNTPILRYSVDKGQACTVHFKVQDNDNAWSNEIVIYIQI